MRPELLAVDDRVVLLFWDKSGREPGVKVRWLDASGRIGGMSVSVGVAKSGLFWPAIDRSPDGSGFWVAWQANPDNSGDDLFLRRLDAELAPHGPEIRATQYGPDKGKGTQVSVPSVAVSSTNLFVAYALDRDRQHLVERMRVPLSLPELQTGGLPEKPRRQDASCRRSPWSTRTRWGATIPPSRARRMRAFSSGTRSTREPTRSSSIPREERCSGESALRRAAATRPLPIAEDGLAEVAFYEAGRVRLAGISRDGVGTTSTFAKVTGDEPRPWIAPGRARGEWLVSWLDVEAGHTEAFVARLQCRN